MDPTEHAEIVAFVASEGKSVRKWPESVNSRYLRSNFRRKAKGFVVGDDGELRKVIGDATVKVVVGEDEKKRVIDGIHSNQAGGGHFGVEKTWYKISSRFWWKGIHEDVREFVRTCGECQRHNPLRKGNAELHPVPFSDRVFALWGMDLVGPLTETPRGNRYIMTVTNYLTRWAVSYAIISDQGREFVNAVNDELCSDLTIKRSLCTAYHPQSNGLTERFNQTLQRVLSKLVESDQTDWDRKLKWATFSYNSSRQSSVKATPFSLLYGVEARLPVETSEGFDDADLDWFGEPDVKATARRLEVLQQLPSVQRMGGEHIREAQAKQKGIYDAKHKGSLTFVACLSH